MDKLQRAFSGEDMMTEPNQDTIDRMQEVMIEKAAELFRLCDKEEKGFITKRDMQRLRSELPVSQDQLEVVFDSLDEDGNGYLSLEEFTDGFGSFLGLKSPSASRDQVDDDVNEQETYEGGLDTIDPEMEAKQFSEMIQQIGASQVFQDEEVIQAMWQRLHRQEPEMASTFEDFLRRLSSDISRSKVDFHSLESALSSKTMEHEEEVKKLYEEMELQIKQEREKIISEEKAKERQLKSELERQLEEKERQLQEILSRHQEMEQKLTQLNQVETITKLENERLQKEKEDLEEMLGKSQEDLEESRTYIQQMQMQAKDEKRERARSCDDILEGRASSKKSETILGRDLFTQSGRLGVERRRQALMMTEGIAIERESLVKQLDILKDVNKKLRDDKDEAEATDARRDGTALSLEDELKVGPASRGSQERSDSTSPRKELCKQGSVLSNYFPPGERPTRKRGSSTLGSSDLENMFRVDHDDDDIEVDDELDEEVLRDANVFYNQPGDHDSQHLRPGDPGWTESRSQLLHHRHGRRVSSLDGGGAEELGQVNEENEEEEEEEDEVGEEEEGGEDGVEGGGKKSTKGGKKAGTKKKKRKFHLRAQRSQPVGADSENVSPEDGSASKPQRIFKVVFVGDSGVGKSSFIYRFCHNEFKGNFAATIGVDFQIKAVTSNNTTSILQVWDTAGQERFRSMTKMYFRKADGVIIMYDVTSEQSFVSVRNWLSSVYEQVEEGTVIMLLGNKFDMSEDDALRPVKEKDGQLVAVENEALFFETSAKSGLNVQEAMEAMANLLQEKEDKRIEDGLKLVEGQKKKGCCGR